MKMPRQWAGLLLVYAFLLAACSVAAAKPGDSLIADGVPGAVVVIGDESVISPLIAFLGGGYPSGDHRLAEQSRVIAACMVERGWVYEAIDPTAGVDPEPSTLGALLDWRSRHGFGLSLDPQSINRDKQIMDRNYEFWQSLDDDGRRRYLLDFDGGTEGVGPASPGSCQARAEAATPAPIYDVAVTAMSQQEFDSVMSNGDMLAATQAWSACMAARGHSYLNRAEPVMDLLENSLSMSADEFRALEIEVAVADLECARTTTLPIQVKLEREVVQRIVAEFPEYATHSG